MAVSMKIREPQQNLYAVKPLILLTDASLKMQNLCSHIHQEGEV
jgi:hypothetical protein